MTETCDLVRRKLAEEGPRFLLRGPSVEEHVAACADCFAFFEELDRLDRVLASLPERDATEPVVDEVLASIEAESTREVEVRQKPVAPPSKREALLAGASIAVALLALWGLVAILPFEEDAPQAPTPAPQAAAPPLTSEETPLPKHTPQPTASPTAPLKSARSVESRETPTSWIEERALLLPPEPDFSQSAAVPPRAARAAASEVDASVHSNEVGGVGGTIALAPGVAVDQTSLPQNINERIESRAARRAAGLESTGAPADASQRFRARQPVTTPSHGYEAPQVAGTIIQAQGDAADRGSSPREIEERVKVHAAQTTVDLESSEVSTKFSGQFIADLPIEGRSYTSVVSGTKQPPAPQGEARVHGGRTRNFTARIGRVRPNLPESSQNTIEEMEAITTGVGLAFGGGHGGFAQGVDENTGARVRSAEARDRARKFLERRSTLEGVTFRPASGYWANTYVPGDPMLRLLGLRLATPNAPAPVAAERLHGAARPLMMPFDPPEHAALNLHVAADRASVKERTRMLVQVGIQGKPVRGSRRPPMNVAVVLDLRGETPPDVAASMRALVDALRRLRDPGDRFSLYVAGRPGGRIAGPEELRYGFLSVALGSLLGDEPPGGPTLDVLEAFSAAHSELAGLDDPTRPIGSSAVLLVTGQQLGDSAESIGALASERALDGVSSSALAVGARVDPSELEAVALAGQGSMRAIAAPAEAADAMARELSAVSRVVARAVRLGIRLAPGVSLIDVLGSGWLDASATEGVLKAQASIDRRTSEQMGIPRDRRPSEEEDGIQILIPNFHAGDSHTVLLDVVADGPGPIADVRMRFKDLVRLENGTARVSLDLSRGQREPGPLERLVLKNLLALELADSLERAGTSVLAGGRDYALARLAGTATLLEGMRLELPDLKADPDLAADLAMLAAYSEALRIADGPAQLAWVGDSLRYAARLEVLPNSRAN